MIYSTCSRYLLNGLWCDNLPPSFFNKWIFIVFSGAEILNCDVHRMCSDWMSRWRSSFKYCLLLLLNGCFRVSQGRLYICSLDHLHDNRLLFLRICYRYLKYGQLHSGLNAILGMERRHCCSMSLPVNSQFLRISTSCCVNRVRFLFWVWYCLCVVQTKWELRNGITNYFLFCQHVDVWDGLDL